MAQKIYFGQATLLFVTHPNPHTPCTCRLNGHYFSIYPSLCLWAQTLLPVHPSHPHSPPHSSPGILKWNEIIPPCSGSTLVYSTLLAIRPRPCWLLQMNFSIYRTPVALQLISEFSLVMCPIFHQRDALASPTAGTYLWPPLLSCLPACLSLSGLCVCARSGDQVTSI